MLGRRRSGSDRAAQAPVARSGVQQQPAQRQVGAAQAAKHARRVFQKVVLLHANLHRVAGRMYDLEALQCMRGQRRLNAEVCSKQPAQRVGGVAHDAQPWTLNPMCCVHTASGASAFSASGTEKS